MAASAPRPSRSRRRFCQVTSMRLSASWSSRLVSRWTDTTEPATSYKGRRNESSTITLGVSWVVRAAAATRRRFLRGGVRAELDELRYRGAAAALGLVCFGDIEGPAPPQTPVSGRVSSMPLRCWPRARSGWCLCGRTRSCPIQDGDRREPDRSSSSGCMTTKVLSEPVPSRGHIVASMGAPIPSTDTPGKAEQTRPVASWSFVQQGAPPGRHEPGSLPRRASPADGMRAESDAMLSSACAAIAGNL